MTEQSTLPLDMLEAGADAYLAAVWGFPVDATGQVLYRGLEAAYRAMRAREQPRDVPRARLKAGFIRAEPEPIRITIEEPGVYEISKEGIRRIQ